MRSHSADALGFTCLPMGWAWAPYIAQKVLEFVLERAGETAFLLHKHPVPLVGNSEGGPSVAMPYLDDFLLIARGGTEKDALEQASERLTRVRGELSNLGFGCHKEGVGSQVRSLGFDLDFKKRKVFPRGDRIADLMLCTRWLVRKGRCSALQLSTLCGHWAWLFTLRTEFYSLFQEVYFFIGQHKDPNQFPRHVSRGTSEWAVPYDLPSGVLGELRSVLRLAPLLFANLGAPPDSEVLATDACGFGEMVRGGDTAGGAGVYTHRPPAEVSELIREAVSWEKAVTPPDDPEFFDPGGWRVGAKCSFRRPEKGGGSRPLSTSHD